MAVSCGLAFSRRLMPQCTGRENLPRNASSVPAMTKSIDRDDGLEFMEAMTLPQTEQPCCTDSESSQSPMHRSFHGTLAACIGEFVRFVTDGFFNTTYMVVCVRHYFTLHRFGLNRDEYYSIQWLLSHPPHHTSSVAFGPTYSTILHPANVHLCFTDNHHSSTCQTSGMRTVVSTGVLEQNHPISTRPPQDTHLPPVSNRLA